VNWSLPDTAEVTPAAVTVTSTVPVPGGAVAVIWELELTVKPAAATPPKVTAVVPERPAPLIVTDVPPAVGPAVGLISETLGSTVKGVGVVAVDPMSDEGPVADTWPVV
jgi:hypothetical protein